MSLLSKGSGLTAALVLALLVTACDTGDQPLGPDLTPDPSYAISDGANGGNLHFNFLPPMVKAPAPEGVFDGGASPVVKICEWVAGACVSGDALRTFTTPDHIQLMLEDELYQVNWNTDVVPAVGTDAVYRILVYSGPEPDGVLVGFADIEFAENKGQAKKMGDGGDETVITLVDGRTLPIKFRIEEFAALTAGCVDVTGTLFIDCDVKEVPAGETETARVYDLNGDGRLAAEVIVPEGRNAAGEVVDVFVTLLLLPLNELPAGGYIPEGDQIPYFAYVQAVDANGEKVFFPQDETGELGAEITVCQADGLDEHPDYEEETLGLVRVDDDGVPKRHPLELTTPASACYGAVEASVFDPHGHPTGLSPFEATARRGLSQLARLVLPEPLYALHGGLNGRGIADFSTWFGSPFPDLTVDDLTVSPATPVVTDDIVLSARVSNTGFGNIEASTARMVVERFGDNGWEERIAVDLPVSALGDDVAETVQYTLVATHLHGLHRFSVTADAGELLGELNEDNNISGWVEFPVTDPTVRPDLVVSAVAATSATVTQGRYLPISFTLENVGEREVHYPRNAPAFRVLAYLSTDDAFVPEDDPSMPGAAGVWTYPLDSGWSVATNDAVMIPSDLPPGDYYVIVYVDAVPSDPYPGVVESNERNNWRAAPFTVVEEGNLIATLAYPWSGRLSRPEPIPDPLEFQLRYDSDAPCSHVETFLARPGIDWNTPASYVWDGTDPAFDSFVSCLTDGTDQWMAYGITDVTLIGREESLSLDVGSVDLDGYEIDYVELIVDWTTVTKPNFSQGITDWTIDLSMRWQFYGLPIIG